MSERGWNNVRFSCTSRAMTIFRTLFNNPERYLNNQILIYLYDSPQFKQLFIEKYGEDSWKMERDHINRTMVNISEDKKREAHLKTLRMKLKSIKQELYTLHKFGDTEVEESNDQQRIYRLEEERNKIEAEVFQLEKKQQEQDGD